MKSTQSEIVRPLALARTRSSARTTLRRARTADGTPERSPRERGAVLVETVLILPILILLVFGVIEISLVYQSSAKVTDASRAVGRTVASLGTDANAPDAAGNAAQAALSSLPKTATPVTMLIYKPNIHNLPGSATTMDPLEIAIGCIASVTCTLTEWSAEAGKFVQSYVDTSAIKWTVAVDEVCGPDYGRVGVIVFASYKPITNLFGDLLSRDGRIAAPGGGINPDFKPLWDRAIFTFDPDLSAECT